MYVLTLPWLLWWCQQPTWGEGVTDRPTPHAWRREGSAGNVQLFWVVSVVWSYPLKYGRVENVWFHIWGGKPSHLFDTAGNLSLSDSNFTNQDNQWHAGGVYWQECADQARTIGSESKIATVLSTMWGPAGNFMANWRHGYVGEEIEYVFDKLSCHKLVQRTIWPTEHSSRIADKVKVITVCH